MTTRRRAGPTNNESDALFLFASVPDSTSDVENDKSPWRKTIGTTKSSYKLKLGLAIFLLCGIWFWFWNSAVPVEQGPSQAAFAEETDPEAPGSGGIAKTGQNWTEAIILHTKAKKEAEKQAFIKTGGCKACTEKFTKAGGCYLPEPDPKPRMSDNCTTWCERDVLDVCDRYNQGIYETFEDVNDGKDVEMVYQCSPHAPPNKRAEIVLMLHGCSHAATDMWPEGDECQKCIGLPIEVNIVTHLLATGYHVVAVSSYDRQTGCWSSDTDTSKILEALDNAAVACGVHGNLIDGYDLVAFGASSGGAMATALTRTGVPQLKGVVSQINAPVKSITIPTLFVHMPRDKNTAAAVQHQLARHKEIAKAIEVKPEPVNEDMFAFRNWNEVHEYDDKIPKAGEIIKILKDNGFLNTQNFLMEDPRHAFWQDHFASMAPVPLQQLNEMLNEAWAAHEFTDQDLEKISDWIADVFAGKYDNLKDDDPDGGADGDGYDLQNQVI